MTNFNKLMKQEQDKFGMTITSFAAACNVGYHVMWQWLNTEKLPTPAQMIHLINALCDLNKTTFAHNMRKVVFAIRDDVDG